MVHIIQPKRFTPDQAELQVLNSCQAPEWLTIITAGIQMEQSLMDAIAKCILRDWIELIDVLYGQIPNGAPGQNGINKLFRLTAKGHARKAELELLLAPETTPN